MCGAGAATFLLMLTHFNHDDFGRHINWKMKRKFVDGCMRLYAGNMVLAIRFHYYTCANVRVCVCCSNDISLFETFCGYRAHKTHECEDSLYLLLQFIIWFDYLFGARLFFTQPNEFQFDGFVIFLWKSMVQPGAATVQEKRDERKKEIKKKKSIRNEIHHHVFFLCPLFCAYFSPAPNENLFIVVDRRRLLLIGGD